MTRSPRRLKEQVKDTVGEQVRDLPLHAVRLAMFGVGRALLLSDRLTKDYKEIKEGGGVRPVVDRLRDDVQTTAVKVVGRVVERVRGEEDAAPAAKPETAQPTRPDPKAHEEISVGKPTPPPETTKPKPEPKPEAATKPEPQPKPKAAAKPEPSPAPETTKPAPEPSVAPEAAAEPGPAPAPETTKPEPEPEPEAAAAEPESEPAAAAEPGPVPAEPEEPVAELPVPNYDAATLPQLRARLRGLSVDQVRLLREYESKHAARADVLKMYENRIAKLNGQG